jgi:Flp pilus assembly protein TadG
MMNKNQPLIHRSCRHRQRRGGSALEMALLMPWYVFLFVGAFDWGFFAHALISVESATRVAALYAASQSSAPSVSTICPIVVNEMKIVSNVGSSLTCGSSPLVVSVTSGTGADGQTAYTVSVTYTTLNLIPIPGLLSRQTTFTRYLEIRPRV